jgi:hypothetical protein
MKHPEFLRLDGGPRTIDDDRRELRRSAKANADANERFLRNLMGDDEYEMWDND